MRLPLIGLMWVWTRAPFRLVLGLFVVSALIACAGTPPPLTPWRDKTLVNTTPLDPDVQSRIFKVNGRELINGRGEQLTLRGIAFGNEVWAHTPLPSAHHTGRDFARVRTMGMNSVRFYLSYRTFEEDDTPGQYKEEGFAWMDQNVEWAKQNGVFLILNMHDPAGGYQSQGKGTRLWEDPEIQERFVYLWRVLAERYRAEPTIIGYDILNEPVPTKSADQWQQLADKTVKAIREVDQHHIIFVERFNAIAGDWSENKERNFIRVDDPNVVYEFHFYKPYHFTHQNASFSDFVAREGWYPDAQIPEADWYELVTEARAESEPLPPGDSDWTLLETTPFVVNDPKLQVGKPFLVCDQGEGEAHFDSLSLTSIRAPEKDVGANPGAAGDEAPLSETLFEMDLDTRRGWYFWTEDGKGKAEFVRKGHGDQSALSIKGTTGPANLGSDPHRFFLEQGTEYQLQALARGEGLGKKASCRIRIEFYSSESQVEARGKEYLQKAIETYLAWGKEQNVPLYLGEFGTIRESFLPGRGGELWVRDMLDVLLKEQVHFAYHAYHESAFGLYFVDGLPTRYGANLPLQALFAEKLGGTVPDPVRPQDGSLADDEESVSADAPGDAAVQDLD